MQKLVSFVMSSGKQELTVIKFTPSHLLLYIVCQKGEFLAASFVTSKNVKRRCLIWATL